MACMPLNIYSRAKHISTQRGHYHPKKKGLQKNKDMHSSLLVITQQFSLKTIFLAIFME